MIAGMSGGGHTDPLRPVIAGQRRAMIEDLLREEGAVAVSDLEERLGVSAMTIRRDLDRLVRHGIAVRTHGGAMVAQRASEENSFARRLDQRTGAKRAVAAAAADLVAPGDTVFVDSSTSSFYVVQELVARGVAVRMVTNSLAVASELDRAGATTDLVLIGGMTRWLTRSFVGPDAVRAAGGHFCDLALLSAKGITPDGFLTDPDALEAEVKRTMVERSRGAILLADAAKLRDVGTSLICPITAIGTLVIADAAPEQLAAMPLAATRVIHVASRREG